MRNIVLHGEPLEYYFVDEEGNIYNDTGRKLKPQTLTTGYERIELNKGLELKGKTYSVHRMVAETFLENPNNLPEVNHKNGIKNDNRVDNLEWVSRSDNQKHMYRELGVDPHNCRRVAQFNTQSGNLLRVFNSTSEASSVTGVNQGTIAYQARNNSKSRGKYTWRYWDLLVKEEQRA